MSLKGVMFFPEQMLIRFVTIANKRATVNFAMLVNTNNIAICVTCVNNGGHRNSTVDRNNGNKRKITVSIVRVVSVVSAAKVVVSVRVVSRESTKRNQR